MQHAADTSKRIADALKGKIAIDYAQAHATNPLLDKQTYVQQALQRYLLERFACRLASLPQSRNLMLKGGMRLYWDDQLASVSRVTTDIDLHSWEVMTHEQIRTFFEQAADVDLGDGLKITIGRPTVLEHVHGEHKGIRFRLVGEQGGIRIPSQVDIGIGGEPCLGMTTVRIKPTLPKYHRGAEINAQPLEYVIAEKVHAICSLGMANTRMKDYRDIIVLMGMKAVDREKVRAAIVDSFKQRGLPITSTRPAGLSLEFAESKQETWERWCDNYQICGLPDDFVEVVSLVHDHIIDFVVDQDAAPAAVVDEESDYAIPALRRPK